MGPRHRIHLPSSTDMPTQQYSSPLHSCGTAHISPQQNNSPGLLPLGASDGSGDEAADGAHADETE